MSVNILVHDQSWPDSPLLALAETVMTSKLRMPKTTTLSPRCRVFSFPPKQPGR